MIVEPPNFSQSAHFLFTNRQKIFILLSCLSLILILIIYPYPSLIFLNGIALLYYLVSIFYKAYLYCLGLKIKNTTPLRPCNLIKDEELPTYTILVPLYREREVIEQLINNLNKIDYPKDKLQILLLLELDDEETSEALKAVNLPKHFQVVEIPQTYPKTKPKALNYGLKAANGELLVIYDAEDEPAVDQLKLAAQAYLQNSSKNIACYQSQLNYYNYNQNWLTKLFAAEYSLWFDLLLPALSEVSAPTPLGGTSNHFKVSVLKSIGGWDAYNVTEDCDLGIRLCRSGYKIQVLNSTTLEEAPRHLLNWLKQRSRWAKGYLQTYIVNMRQPIKALKELRFFGFLHFQLLIGGTLFSFYINPLYWGMTVFWLMFHFGFIPKLFPNFIYYSSLFCCFIGNFLFVYFNMLAATLRGHYPIVRYQLLTPIYWLLMSIGAYKGLIELFYKPHYWYKTLHGFFKSK